MDERLRALLLLNCVGNLDVRVWRKMETAGLPPRALWEDVGDLKEAGITEHVSAKIKERACSDWAEREFARCEMAGVTIITCEDARYPTALEDLADAPLLLYCLGNAVERIFEKSVRIGVVGTRRASPYGKRTAQTIGEYCAASGLPHISGGASGIDGNAHAGCCRAGGMTAAVFGTGIDVCFPASHKQLFEQILERGALISEYPFGTKGEPWRFPRRNRIVAALSQKLIVAEAPEKSGAMITARMALELGREVWAVPGRIDEDICGGSNRLIYDGAYPLTSMEVFFGTIFGQQSIFTDDKIIAENRGAAALNLSEGERHVYEQLRLKGERTVDNLAVDVKMSAADLLKIVALLSAKGIIVSSGPGRYSVKV